MDKKYWEVLIVISEIISFCYIIVDWGKFWLLMFVTGGEFYFNIKIKYIFIVLR